MNVSNASNSVQNASRESNGHTYIELEGAREWFQAALVLVWLFAILAVGLNIAVIMCICRQKKKSRLYFLLLNMAVADFLTGLFDTVVNATERSLGYDNITWAWYAGRNACKIQRTATSVFAMTSNFILAATSFDRAIAIAKPLINFKQGFNVQKVLVVLCWIFSTLLSIPVFLVMHVFHVFVDKAYFLCHIDNNVISFDTITHYLLVFQYLLPLLTILVSYVVLLCALGRRSASCTETNSSGNGLLRIFNATLPRAKTRSLKLMCGIVAGFVVAWTPYFTISYLSLYAGFNHSSLQVGILSYYLNGIINPVVFFIFHHTKPARSPTSFYSNETAISTSRITKESFQTFIPASDVNCSENTI
ncbi:cardioacceleratory peptide receptor-like [Mya arenaria]|uniref:cardioacceleratory peptide receptor-like n=1 Tax=Mya arenaria TaxID=6604 RepID=UPI0022E6E6B6|nr:cardioacceleratory peptide receptor-like [Mya arenaria]